jgi:hypothetical protein
LKKWLRRVRWRRKLEWVGERVADMLIAVVIGGVALTVILNYCVEGVVVEP